ncbi:Os11g0549680, partial [Oryza sativa Japonica Group]
SQCSLKMGLMPLYLTVLAYQDILILGDTLLRREDHVVVSYPMKRRKKPCFVCGLFGHNSKQCMQNLLCFGLHWCQGF